MTVGELIERLHQFDESLEVYVRDTARHVVRDAPVHHANLPEHEQYVLLTTALRED